MNKNLIIIKKNFAAKNLNVCGSCYVSIRQNWSKVIQWRLNQGAMGMERGRCLAVSRLKEVCLEEQMQPELSLQIKQRLFRQQQTERAFQIEVTGKAQKMGVLKAAGCCRA